MTHTYKNITIDFDTMQYPDLTGDTLMTVSSEMVSRLIEESCNFSTMFLEYQIEEFYGEIGRDEDAAAEHFKNLDEEVQITNPDAIIAVYEFALNNKEEKFSFEVESENISWVLHDILHAIHDVAGCTTYVESAIEAERITKSLEQTKELFPHMMPDFGFLENLEQEFKARFNEGLDLDEFKHSYDEEEEEEYYG